MCQRSPHNADRGFAYAEESWIRVLHADTNGKPGGKVDPVQSVIDLWEPVVQVGIVRQNSVPDALYNAIKLPRWIFHYVEIDMLSWRNRLQVRLAVVQVSRATSSRFSRNSSAACLCLDALSRTSFLRAPPSKSSH